MNIQIVKTGSLKAIPEIGIYPGWRCEIIVDDLAITTVVPYTVQEKDIQKYLDDHYPELLESALTIYGAEFNGIKAFKEFRKLKDEIKKAKE